MNNTPCNRTDMKGQKFNKLTVLEYAGTNKHHSATWKCKCDCGNEIIATGHNLRTNHTKSCGCLIKEEKNNTKHNMSRTRQYKIWAGMKKRCTNINYPHFNDYGGREIKVCDRWLESFENFWEDMQEGYSDNLSIDRIDNNGNYEKSNCKWSNREEQSNNRRNNIIVTYNGVTDTLKRICDLNGFKYQTVFARIKYQNMPISEAFY